MRPGFDGVCLNKVLLLLFIIIIRAAKHCSFARTVTVSVVSVAIELVTKSTCN